VCIFSGGKGTKGRKMKGIMDILNVCPTHFEIFSHIEGIVINDRDVLKFDICVEWPL
jgi:hypothetical protein